MACGIIRPMEKTTLYLSGELQRSLRELARRTGRRQADLIREALTEYVGRVERPWPRSIGAAADGSLDAADGERWLRDEWERQASEPETAWVDDDADARAERRPGSNP